MGSGAANLLKLIAQNFDILASPVLSLAYPLYASIRAIETKSPVDDQQWLTYWVLYSMITLLELTFAKLIECLIGKRGMVVAASFLKTTVDTEWWQFVGCHDVVSMATVVMKVVTKTVAWANNGHGWGCKVGEGCASGQNRTKSETFENSRTSNPKARPSKDGVVLGYA
ncbi:hypothetical protein E3N88_39369 [Mikania micrantha]|uniref:HVA22-like protein n=1 Tax=Mikania micrantha TaxID=192012 RepID=A0A5N6LZ75_9ASTR|nr:hypothetical protein E3N88_39369 [Mikania micrantha]